jgi:3-oxoacyl-[acyl-carrier-protein] synthase III
MNPLKSVKLLGTGKYLPGEAVPFDDVEKFLGRIEGMPEKIAAFVERTKPTLRGIIGMDYYYYALDPVTRLPTETHASMAAKASRQAMEAAGVEASEIDFIAFGGANLERLISPPTSTFVQQELGIERCAEISIHANCTASYKALQVAYDALRLGRHKTALVVSSSIISTLFRAEYYNPEKVTRNQALLRWFLCDGAGALVLRATDEVEEGLYLEGVTSESVGGNLEPGMYTEFMGNELLLPKTFESGRHHFTQDLKRVGDIGPAIFLDACQRMMADFSMDLDSITYFMANIPNKLFWDNAVAQAKEKFGLEPERFYSTLKTRGYCGPPAILITLDDFLATTQTQPGESIASVVTESSKWMNAGFCFRHF